MNSVLKSTKDLVKKNWFLPAVLVIVVVGVAIFQAKREMFGPFDTDPQYTGFGMFPKAIAQLFIGKEMISYNKSSDNIASMYVDSEFKANAYSNMNDNAKWYNGSM